jgi:diguanylate cyclase (GGDEF)-like protein
VRLLGTCGSFERLFDLFAQFLSQVISYRWVALTTVSPERFFLHHHPHAADVAEQEARGLLGLARSVPVLRVVDEDARSEPAGPPIVTSGISFGNLQLGRLALAPSAASESNTSALFGLVARELGGPVRMAALVDEQQRLAAIDSLTGLRNRRSFLEQLQIEVERCKRYGLPLCVLMLDVDHFKANNDGHGHNGGDQVLSALGTLLRSRLRIPDLSARWGGEEFVIALTNTDAAGGEVAADRLRQAIEQLLVPHGEAKIPVTASVGLAALSPSDSLESLVDRADRAMYAAKMMGRNRLVVAETSAAVVETRDTASL